MTDKRIAPYGSWASPITAELVASSAVTLAQVEMDDSEMYWLEGRPTEGGRTVVVRYRPGGSMQDVTPAPFNVRTRVHEYGGGAYAVANGSVYFSNFSDNRLYRQDLDGEPVPLTPEGSVRYADIAVDRQRARLICVREDHTDQTREPVNAIGSVSLNPAGKEEILIEGNDFYSSPVLSPDGNNLAWLTWNHPNLPWNGTELWIGDIAVDGSILRKRQIAGGADVSIFQPQWSPDGTLFYISDRTGWWNLYRYRGGQEEALHPMEAEFGVPQWVFRMSTFACLDSEQIVAAYHRGGSDHIALLHTDSKQLRDLDVPYRDVSSIRAHAGTVACIGGSPSEPFSIVTLVVDTGQIEVLKRSITVPIEAGYFSAGREIEFPTNGGKIAYAIYYAPHNPNYEAPEGELPPLIVRSHGGPTGSASSTLSFPIQFWTSRGFAFTDVNYGGSAGYGREYRERLTEQWGVVDVDDCVHAARYLAEHGMADPERLIIVGGSAGGYTTLRALTSTNVFAAGASYYGVADLEFFAQDTHKFESRYLDQLVGPLSQSQDVYRDRSPIQHVDRFSSPVILFQGLDDKVVPPNQADRMTEALRTRKIPFAYVAFEGEGHGFRRAQNIRRRLEAELYFYARIFGFDLPEAVEPVQIENLAPA